MAVCGYVCVAYLLMKFQLYYVKYDDIFDGVNWVYIYTG